jgi:hypothetical protein
MLSALGFQSLNMKSGPFIVQRFCEAGVSTCVSYFIFLFYLVLLFVFMESIVHSFSGVVRIGW